MMMMMMIILMKMIWKLLIMLGLILRTLKILTLIMMIILMNMIWKLLIMLDLWLDIIDLSNGRHVGKELMLVVWHPTR